MAHEEAAFSSQHSAVSQSQKQHQNQKPFTTEGAEDAEESKTLLLSHGKMGKVNADEQEQVKKRAEALALKLAQTYEELTRLLEHNPGVKRQITEGEAREDKVYQKLQHRLKLADMAPRCRWVRQDGTSCQSPEMKQHIYCFAHRQMAEARTLMLMLPAPEDANAIQVGLMRIQKALIEDTITTKKAGLLLYSMQLALTNVGQTTFGQAKDEEMVRETVDEEEAFSQTQGTFTTEGTEDTEKNQGLPLMNTDDTDFGEAGVEDGAGDVEFVPVPGGYGFERVRLRIEPSGHLAVASADHLTPSCAKAAWSGSPDNREIGAAADREIRTISSLRDERLPKGPRFASEPLDADTVVGSVLQTEPYANLG